MAPYEHGDTPAEGPRGPERQGAPEGSDATRPLGGRKAARYVVPFAVVGVAAATIGLVPALADSGDPDLPKVSAEQLLTKIAKSDTQQLSGTVKINTDLGLPDFSAASGLLNGAQQGGKGGAGGSSADPQSKLMELASGTHTLQVAADGQQHQKLSVLGNASEYSIIHNGDQLWAYDSASNQAYHATQKGADRIPREGERKKLPENVPTSPDQMAREALKSIDDTTSVKVDGTERIAGRDAYKLVVEPKQAGSTVGQISVAVDAEEGVPLKFTLTPSSGGAAVIDAGFTKVDFGKPAASTFDFTPPKGTKVTEADQKGADHAKAHASAHARGDLRAPHAAGAAGAPTVIGKGWSAIAEFGGEGGHGSAASPDGMNPHGQQQMLESLGDRVHGKFGTGTVFSTRLVNALITDDGKVYAGMVTKDALLKAAESGH
ncbi:outer membrane lipoprotein carrier protein LolA [Streptomyces sp. TS71-3]|uniref:LolA family protein n=1 Tax=Streptomyces sp. TS71-3 TaxID=2733862 RepID=UPI001B1F9622|nr:outer membrane lipoprotein carrier protein LolA [Streptomyces sp. TS71-3]GHJ34870.1 hypothetical protein Sm713_04790 [Streptomyces sp. TS71-3]